MCFFFYQWRLPLLLWLSWKHAVVLKRKTVSLATPGKVLCAGTFSPVFLLFLAMKAVYGDHFILKHILTLTLTHISRQEYRIFTGPLSCFGSFISWEKWLTIDLLTKSDVSFNVQRRWSWRRLWSWGLRVSFSGHADSSIWHRVWFLLGVWLNWSLETGVRGAILPASQQTAQVICVWLIAVITCTIY